MKNPNLIVIQIQHRIWIQIQHPLINRKMDLVPTPTRAQALRRVWVLVAQVGSSVRVPTRDRVLEGINR